MTPLNRTGAQSRAGCQFGSLGTSSATPVRANAPAARRIADCWTIWELDPSHLLRAPRAKRPAGRIFTVSLTTGRVPGLDLSTVLLEDRATDMERDRMSPA